MSEITHGIHRPGEVLAGNTSFFTAYTLVDITDTADSNPKGNTVTYRQAQNLNSLIQALSLRTQLVLSSVSSIVENTSGYAFGTDFTGTQSIWIFKFASEAPDTYANGDNQMYFASDDTHGVPIHNQLDESATISNIFDAKSDSSKNIYFTFSDSL